MEKVAKNLPGGQSQILLERQMRNNSYNTTSMKQCCVKLSVATLQIEEASASYSAAALASAGISS